MFCKKCGKSIKDSAVFCPYCGGQIKKEGISEFGRNSGELANSFLTEKEKGKFQVNFFANGWKRLDKKKLLGIICGCVIFITAFSFWMLLGKDSKIEEKEYSVVGEWSCDDLSDLGYILGEAVGGGIEGEAIEYAIGNALGAATVTFTESGQIYISFYDVSITIGKINYEIISNNRMMLAYEIEIPILGNAVTASYNADYKVNKDTMSLDFFGERISLDREAE